MALRIVSLFALLIPLVPSQAALVFHDPLQGSTLGTTNHVAVFRDRAVLTAPDSWVKYTSSPPLLPKGTLSFWLRTPPGSQGPELVTMGYRKDIDGTVWPTWNVKIGDEVGGKHALTFTYWVTGPTHWHSIDTAPVLDPGVWYHIGVTWGAQSPGPEGMAIWVDADLKATDPAYTRPPEEPPGYTFEAWGLGRVFSDGLPSTSHWPCAVRDLRIYDTIEDFGDTNSPPTLTWARQPGFWYSGCSPNQPQHLQKVDFRVRYMDHESHPPDPGVALRLFRNGGEVTGSPFTMVKAAGTDYRAGVIYRFSRKLPWGDYSYTFESSDGYLMATGPASTLQSGPEVITPPVLANPRVIPLGGDANERFRYWVDYGSIDGKRARWVELQVKTYVPGEGWQRHAFRKSAIDAGTSVLWKFQTAALDPDATLFQYRYMALKGRGRGRLLTDTPWRRGPEVTGGAAGVLALTSLGASPTAAGAELTFTLSRAAAVSARVLNVAGRPVKALCSSRQCHAATNRLLWNATGDSGLPVPRGTYMLEVTAISEGGGSARSVTRVSINR